MPLRFISISKILFDNRWNELGSSELGARQQSNVYTMIVMRANSPQATLKIKIVGEEHPVELSFTSHSQVRIGSGMLGYDNSDLESNGLRSLPVDSLDNEN